MLLAFMLEFLANVNVNSRSRSLYAIARPSVCRLSVTLVRPTQAVEISAIFVRHLVPWPSINIHRKFYREPLRRES